MHKSLIIQRYSFYALVAFVISFVGLNAVIKPPPKIITENSVVLAVSPKKKTEIVKVPEILVGKKITDYRALPLPTGNGSFEHYKELILSVAYQTEVSPKLLAKIAAIESSFNHQARAKSVGGAVGLYQFVGTTWDETVKRHGKEYGITRAVNRTDARASTILAAKTIKDNLELLEKVITNRPITYTDLYIVHFLGRTGAVRFFTYKPNTILAYQMPAAAKGNKEIFYKKGGARTVEEVYQHLDARLKFKVREFNITLG